ncbi:MAG: hypothetical protein RL681_129 [Candidatus Parcubacteria bacterium]
MPKTPEEVAAEAREKLLKGDPERVARQREAMYKGKALRSEGVPESGPVDYKEGQVSAEEMADASRWSLMNGIKGTPAEKLQAYRAEQARKAALEAYEGNEEEAA